MRTIAFLFIALLMLTSQCKMTNKSEKANDEQVQDTLAIDTVDVHVQGEAAEE